MVSPAVRTSHCSGVKNIAKVLVPGDDVVEHVPVLRSWVHPSDLVNILVFENRVGDYQVFLCAETEQQQTIGVLLAGSMWAQHSRPGMLVSADPCIEIPEQQKLILAWYAVDGFTQAGVKGLPLLIRVGHSWSIDTDEGQVCFARQGQTQCHYAVWDPFGKRGEAWGYVISDGKANTRDTWFGLCFATPEEGVACSHFFHTACVRPSGFAECSYGDVVPSQLVANDCCHALRTTVSIHEGPHIPGTEIDFGFVCPSFPSGFVCLSFSTAEVDVQPAAVSWQDRGEASFV